MKDIWCDIAEYGRKLTEKGFVCGHGGNISIRIGESIYITRRGTSLENITFRNIICIPLNRESESDSYASTEAPVHREIYNRTNYKAIIHVHPPYSIAISYFFDEIEPLEIEVAYTMGVIKVIEGKSGTIELGKRIVENIDGNKAVIVRGHGIFSVGFDLEDAYRVVCAVERNCRQKYLVELLKSNGYKFIKPKDI
ncbi:MAG: class II aldolase/adducin family protein [Candidatus Methanomethylicia archaeon]|nr:class II aldolase/adducin family protein [Candidatus Methanomethylicia archaeon]